MKNKDIAEMIFVCGFALVAIALIIVAIALVNNNAKPRSSAYGDGSSLTKRN